jgi:adenosylmethionine-8-amino-7-oxononanoate aminotransferase
MYHPLFLSEAKQLCERYGLHFIADEVLVGFGRTGSMFACEQADITPDFLVLSKGLTGGYLPLSVVLTTEEVYGSFYCDYNPSRSFLHSHSYTGNALACAAANATLDIFESEHVIENNRRTIALIEEELKCFEGLERVKEVRQCGMIAAIELEGFDPRERVGLKIHQHCMREGVLIRPLGSVIYVMTPYVITNDELKRVFSAIERAIESIDI